MFVCLGVSLFLWQPATGEQIELASYSSEDLDSIDPNLKTFPKASPGIGDDQEVEEINPKAKAISADEMRLAKLQILLDRLGLSPGAINGQATEHLDRVVKLYQSKQEAKLLVESEAAIDEALNANGGEAFETYTLTAKDIAGPFEPEIPSRIQDQAELKRLSFRNVEEAIAERFHMDEGFLNRLNANVDFAKAGSKIKVANIGRYLDQWVGRIHADKQLKQVTAYDTKGRVLAVYPASIGSLETPSPKGEFKVRNKAGFPAYTLAANNSFEVIDNGQQVVVAPGPNNPVGSAWIGLSKKTYGIHGTPEPSSIGQAESHGCIRLTNWDALELARLVRNGVVVTIE